MLSSIWNEKSVCCSYSTNLTRRVINLIEETSNSSTAHHSTDIQCHRTECMMLQKTNSTIIKGSKFNPQHILWDQAVSQCHWQESQTTTLVRKLPTDYLEQFTPNRHNKINLHWKDNYLLVVFFDMPTKTTTDAKGSISAIVKKTGHKQLSMTAMF